MDVLLVVALHVVSNLLISIASFVGVLQVKLSSVSAIVHDYTHCPSANRRRRLGNRLGHVSRL